MGGIIYQIGSDFGQIWYNKSFGGILRMDPHPRLMMRKNFHWLIRQIIGRGGSLIPNLRLENKARNVTCQRWNVFTVMIMDTMPQIVHKRRRTTRRLQELQRVKLWPHSLSWTSLSSHAWRQLWWDLCGTWIVDHLSTWWETKNYLEAWRRRIFRCTSRWVMMGGIALLGLVQSISRDS